MNDAEKVSSLKIRMVAGEASGDLLAGLLLKGVNERWAHVDKAGVGGAKMEAQGFHCWDSYDQLAIHGYVDAIKNYRQLSLFRKNLLAKFLADQPDLFIGVDAPDFNLGLEFALKKQGIKTVHFVSPSIWAWRGWRMKTIAKSADLVLCLFPFEPAIYTKAGVRSAYVGHPLADEIPLEIDRSAVRQKLNIPDARQVVALMPGSRRSEINQLASTFIGAAKELLKKRPELQFILPVAPNRMEMLVPLVESSGIGEQIILLDGQAGMALAAADVALIASGTATLEAALYKCPMVIAYKVGAISAAIFKRMSYLPWIGLPNILCEETIVPERIQKEMNAGQLAQDVLDWLDSPDRVKRLKVRFTELHYTLRCNTARAASDAIEEFINC